MPGATDPRNNPDAPPHPFVLPEYTIGQDSIASAERERSATSWALARQYDAHGDRYVLLTVVFASVLFFAGISEKFDEDRVRIGVLVMGTILFGGAFAVMMSYPVWW